ncbi:M20/M25/M40 family metallo-hydrolase [Sphingobacterium olei]|uniref:M20/M25/M40 family metallo-hydrolase n=1 Tax=Sphingobacterium olei TaxID=2571155 RepID=A0A4U0P4G4_9SPHI|nr:M20/M25/M40 family metallo-hydrolase [Sphingobacterium olei]TJZ62276.1 M20/M25/M40 family metallo-hydrolase [Sphingobacterium olei]
MIKYAFLLLGFSSSLCCTLAQQPSVKPVSNKEEIARILNTLASDDMQGRHAFTPNIAKAADFIADEFKTIGLKPYAEDNYRQTFSVRKIIRKSQKIMLNKKILAENEYLILGNNPVINWKEYNTSLRIDKGEDFAIRFREIATSPEDAIVLVHPSFAEMILRFNKIYGRENVLSKTEQHSPAKVFIVTNEKNPSIDVHAENEIQDFPLFNVAGMLPGKSKPEEFVIFSAHYDHIGIIQADGQDSIANGADDDASGTTAMISLAKYYATLNNNERTLIFVAFTAEEIGMYGSKYFSNEIDPEKVVAMINIEMIGKDSKFGPNTMYITGYNASNLGQLMQSNLQGSTFQFHPDPYPQQNLFYRSDNAVLAALGVPAHTFSTSQIDKDTYYHTVKDEVGTLDLDNIKSSIEAIAIGAKGLVDGTQTPSRVERLKD